MNALSRYLDRQVDLQAAQIQGLNQLREMGHASVLECEESQLKLDRLKIRTQACEKHLRFLAEFEKVDNNIGDSEVASRLLIDLSQLLELPNGSQPVVVLNLNDQTSDLVQQLASMDERRRALDVNGIERRLHLVKQIIDRLNAIPNRLPAEDAEIAHLQKQHKLLQAEIELVQVSPASIRAIDAARWAFRGDTLHDTQSQLVLLNEEWRKALLKAEVDVLNAELGLLRKRSVRLAKLEADGKGLPNELARSNARLRQLERMTSEIEESMRIVSGDEAGKPKQDVFEADSILLDHTLTQSEQARRATMEANSTQTMLKKVSRLAATDEFFSGERDWLTGKLAVQMANVGVRTSQSARLYALQSSGDDNFRLVSTRESKDTQPIGLSVETLLRELLAGEVEDRRIEQAQAELAVATNRSAAIQQLQSEGHASWRESATANMIREVRETELTTRTIDREAIDLYVRLIDALEQQTPKPADDNITLR